VAHATRNAARARRRLALLLSAGTASRVHELIARPVLFFGGKGGVGKTTLAAAAALHSARLGHRTLLVSTDPAHSAGDVLDTELGPEPRPIAPHLVALEIDPHAEAERHIDEVKQRIGEVASPRVLAEVEREIDVARVSPGATEAALFDRLAQLALLAGTEFDRVVFDTAPTGHTIRLLSLPEVMGVWIDGLVRRRRKTNALARMWRNVAGAAASAQAPLPDPVLQALESRRDRFRAARERLTDPDWTAFHFILTADRLPILETRRAVEALGGYGIPVGTLVVNRIPQRSRSGLPEARRDRIAGSLDTIRDTFRHLPVRYLPESDEEVHGAEALLDLLTLLSSEPPDAE
jgi:arsenite/tail-anchored protein-transporting ATPase